MKANDEFVNQPKSFWACVRKISEEVGYTAKGQNRASVPSLDQISSAMASAGLDSSLFTSSSTGSICLAESLYQYFNYRADVLNRFVEPRLMDPVQAKKEFRSMKKLLCPRCPLPMNKQKGEKKAPAYLTGMVNMIIEANAGGMPCDFDPRKLTIFTRANMPLGTLARRVDGAFPSTVNPVAVWEVKEYYYTTTFGSRVADGIYETLLDGMELAELRKNENVHVLHYLFVDSHFTWWECGRSYLCRLLDALHMGYVDEVIFGCELIERLPVLVKQWVEIANTRMP
ncbi:MAG TPA: hypothetical protein VM141_10995 [Planctomycetota bacterium]|nr:hypothetical protein [Planctomycetota bacterium]